MWVVVIIVHMWVPLWMSSSFEHLRMKSVKAMTTKLASGVKKYMWVYVPLCPHMSTRTSLLLPQHSTHHTRGQPLITSFCSTSFEVEPLTGKKRWRAEQEGKLLLQTEPWTPSFPGQKPPHLTSPTCLSFASFWPHIYPIDHPIVAGLGESFQRSTREEIRWFVLWQLVVFWRARDQEVQAPSSWEGPRTEVLWLSTRVS